jgi:hypothetical protein
MSDGPATHALKPDNPGRSGRQRTALIGVVVIVGLVSFALTRVIWPDPAGVAGPPAQLLPGFVVLAALESLLFGLGVAFLLTGLASVRRAGRRTGLARAAHAAIVWMLLSWWPHDNFHRALSYDHDNWSGLLALEYGFHFTLIVASIVVAAYFIDTLRTAR